MKWINFFIQEGNANQARTVCFHNSEIDIENNETLHTLSPTKNLQKMCGATKFLFRPTLSAMPKSDICEK